MAAYYPRRAVTTEDLLDGFKRFDLEGFNEKEEDRLEAIQLAKLRGKGAPKKKRSAAGEHSPKVHDEGTTDQCYRKPEEQRQEISASIGEVGLLYIKIPKKESAQYIIVQSLLLPDTRLFPFSEDHSALGATTTMCKGKHYQD